jgi:hypothetical protein
MYRSTEFNMPAMTTRFWALCSALLVLSLYVPPVFADVAATAAPINVKAARVWPSPEYSRVAVEFDAPVSYKYFSLKIPNAS